MLIVAAELHGKQVDVRCQDGVIAQIAPTLRPRAQETLLPAHGGALLPGLHDHHIHLYALAAANASVQCGPPQVQSALELARALQSQPGSGWLRGVAYHESVAGDLDRRQLDTFVSDRPLRIQHRGGKLWLLNSLAIDLLGLAAQRSQPGIERDSRGRPTGRLMRMDPWLRQQLRVGSAPDLSPLSRELAACGVTGVTDASVDNSAAAMTQLAKAIAAGELLQRVLLLGDARLPESRQPLIDRGAVKILLDDDRLPEYSQLLQRIRQAHGQHRGVAIHCVTRTELIFALTALLEAGGHGADRIEHASVTPDAALPLLQRSGATVVTQPGFIFERGDQYRQDVAVMEQPFLYRCQGFLDAGVPLAAGSDAPYGSPDPWLAMRAANQRRSREGCVLGSAEKLTPERALALYTGTATSPGGASRVLEPGAPADMCLLDRPWQQARQRLNRADVLATVRAGLLIYHRDQGKHSQLENR